MRHKTIYALRLRSSDSEAWGPPEYFRGEKKRDEAAAFARIIGGYRTWSYSENDTEERKADQDA